MMNATEYVYPVVVVKWQRLRGGTASESTWDAERRTHLLVTMYSLCLVYVPDEDTRSSPCWQDLKRTNLLKLIPHASLLVVSLTSRHIYLEDTHERVVLRFRPRKMRSPRALMGLFRSEALPLIREHAYTATISCDEAQVEAVHPTARTRWWGDDVSRDDDGHRPPPAAHSSVVRQPIVCRGRAAHLHRLPQRPNDSVRMLYDAFLISLSAHVVSVECQERCLTLLPKHCALVRAQTCQEWYRGHVYLRTWSLSTLRAAAQPPQAKEKILSGACTDCAGAAMLTSSEQEGAGEEGAEVPAACYAEFEDQRQHTNVAHRPVSIQHPTKKPRNPKRARMTGLTAGQVCRRMGHDVATQTQKSNLPFVGLSLDSVHHTAHDVLSNLITLLEGWKSMLSEAALHP